MTVIKSIFSNVISDIISDVIQADDTVRYITLLDPSVDQHYAIPVTNGTPVTMTIYPKNGNLGLPTGAPAVTDNVWQTITYTATADNDFLGRNGTDYFEGGIWDYKISTSNYYKLDEDFSTTTVAKNSLAVLGSELVVNGGFDSGLSNWAGNISQQSVGSVEITAQASTIGRITQPYDFSVANQFLLEITVHTDGVNLYNYSAYETVFIGVTEAGKTYSVTFDGAPTRGIDIRMTASEGVVLAVSEISIKQADGYGTAVNIDGSGTQLYTKQPNGNMLGEDGTLLVKA